MAKEMRVRFVITLSVLVLVVSMSEGLSHAQQQDNRTYGGLKPNEILIINDDKSVTVPINLRNGGYGSYTTFTLAPEGRQIYLNTTEILLKTDNGNSVNYRLEYGNRYKIFWSPSRNRWDLNLIIN